MHILAVANLVFLLCKFISSSSAEFLHHLGTGDFHLSNLLIENDRRIYACSERFFYSFHSNGTIAWSLRLPYSCNITNSPISGGRGKIYLIAENKVVIINFQNSPPSSDVFFGKDEDAAGDIIGIASCSTTGEILINVKNRGLFVYSARSKLQWSVGPTHTEFEYRIGCINTVDQCFFSSVPVIDSCESSVLISNSLGEIYSISIRTSHYNWVKDISPHGRTFTITPGNNGIVYVTFPTKSLILAMDAFSGAILWQKTIGPLASGGYTPVVDCNGWISTGSLDGFLYSISRAGEVRKFSKVPPMEHVIQVSPVLHCSCHGVFMAQTLMSGKMTRAAALGDDATSVSALQPKGSVFTFLNPATGTVLWSDTYRGGFPPYLLGLRNFMVDDSILLSFIANYPDGRFRCRSKYDKLSSTCAEAVPAPRQTYIGNVRRTVLFLVFETITVITLAALVHFCYFFWKKKKLKGQKLGVFFLKRRALQRSMKECDRIISELKQNGGEESVHEIGRIMEERESIERKLTTSYSLGRDRTGIAEPVLPISGERFGCFSFRNLETGSVGGYGNVSDSSPSDASSDGGEDSNEDGVLLRRFGSRLTTSVEGNAVPFRRFGSFSG